jgi:hypothetical protein
LGTAGSDLDPPPGRVLIVGPGHTFEQLAEAINQAFARWDLSHLHEFELGDGRRIGFPSEGFEPELAWEDQAALKVADEVRPAEEFNFTFDFGDRWRQPLPGARGEGRSARGIRPRAAAQAAGRDVGMGLDPRSVRAGVRRGARARRVGD